MKEFRPRVTRCSHCNDVTPLKDKEDNVVEGVSWCDRFKWEIKNGLAKQQAVCDDRVTDE